MAAASYICSIFFVEVANLEKQLATSNKQCLFYDFEISGN